MSEDQKATIELLHRTVASLRVTIDKLKEENIRLTTDQANDPTYAALRATITELEAFIEITWPLTALKSKILEKYPEYADIVAALKEKSDG